MGQCVLDKLDSEVDNKVKRRAQMDSKNTCMCNVILNGVGILLLLTAAFDVLPLSDNLVIFIALACFIISGIIKKATKGMSNCCK